MHFLQRQIRLCSSRIAQPLENAVDFDENNIKVINIPKIALQTQSQPIQHEPDNGHLFNVSKNNIKESAGKKRYHSLHENKKSRIKFIISVELW